MRIECVRRLGPVLLVLSVLCVVGCANQEVTRSYPQLAVVLTDGVTIEAEDESWALSGIEAVTPPFQSDWQVDVKLGDGANAAAKSTAELDLLELVGEALAKGAQRVRVKVPGREKPLYGVLALSPVADSTKDSAAARAYRIEVPAERVSQALGARMSAVYSPYTFVQREIDAITMLMIVASFGLLAGQKDQGAHVYYRSATWVLWLSDAPIAG